jgi:hypothetical protein
MDPALQDFFVPQGSYADQGPGRPPEPGYRIADPWDDQAPAGGPYPPAEPRTPTGPSRVPRGFLDDDDDDDDERSGLGTRAYIAIGVVVAIVIVVGVVLFTHHSSGSAPTAPGATASGAATIPTAQPTATAAGPSGATGTTAAYKLATPSTAGGYHLGQDPKFLSLTKSTAQQVASAMTSAGGGSVTGSPVSAAYQLPDSQAIMFVGYQGSFTPAKVETILSSIGSDAHTFSAGSHGGTLGCVNTPATATATSGAVCIWATSSTLGVTEFFTATGPESLTDSQNKGASDTLKLRADVETK